MSNYSFKTFLPIELEDEARNLFYFNSNQHKYRDKIIRVIQEYGKPELEIRDFIFTFRLSGPMQFQETIFVCDRDFGGIPVAIFICIKKNNWIEIVHVARKENKKYDNLILETLPELGKMLS
jgi:hypothetical protein